MDMGLRGKRAIVLASSRGLGRVAAEALAAEGCHLALCARSEDQLIATARQIEEKYHVDVYRQRVDLAISEQLEKFIRDAISHMSGVDILVTNAGGPPVKYFAETSDDEWRQWFEIIFMSVVRSVRNVLPEMKKQKRGRIINITSITVKSPLERLTYSNALRLAVVGLAKTLANECGPYGITVNNVAPGYHLTDGLERIIRKRMESGEEREAILKNWSEKIPVRRIGEAHELADLICFLASDKAGFINGATIQADGGMYQGVL